MFHKQCPIPCACRCMQNSALPPPEEPKCQCWAPRPHPAADRPLPDSPVSWVQPSSSRRGSGRRSDAPKASQPGCGDSHSSLGPEVGDPHFRESPSICLRARGTGASGTVGDQMGWALLRRELEAGLGRPGSSRAHQSGREQPRAAVAPKSPSPVLLPVRWVSRDGSAGAVGPDLSAAMGSRVLFLGAQHRCEGPTKSPARGSLHGVSVVDHPALGRPAGPRGKDVGRVRSGPKYPQCPCGARPQEGCGEAHLPPALGGKEEAQIFQICFSEEEPDVQAVRGQPEAAGQTSCPLTPLPP